eukprot:SAG11_NODE_1572_length_4664_cov_8.611172_3_plen_181_part_00
MLLGVEATHGSDGFGKRRQKSICHARKQTRFAHRCHRGAAEIPEGPRGWAWRRGSRATGPDQRNKREANWLIVLEELVRYNPWLVPRVRVLYFSTASTGIICRLCTTTFSVKNDSVDHWEDQYKNREAISTLPSRRSLSREWRAVLRTAKPTQNLRCCSVYSAKVPNCSGVKTHTRDHES